MNVEEMIAKLDERYGQLDWDLYRAANGTWRVKLRGHETLSGGTLTEALQVAVNYTPLPRIPLEPRIIDADDCRITKQGSRWHLQLPNGGSCFLPTKKEAVEVAKKFEDQSRKKNAEWRQEYGHIVASGTEGVDFRWDNSS